MNACATEHNTERFRKLWGIAANVHCKMMKILAAEFVVVFDQNHNLTFVVFVVEWFCLENFWN